MYKSIVFIQVKYIILTNANLFESHSIYSGGQILIKLILIHIIYKKRNACICQAKLNSYR